MMTVERDLTLDLERRTVADRFPDQTSQCRIDRSSIDRLQGLQHAWSSSLGRPEVHVLGTTPLEDHDEIA